MRKSFLFIFVLARFTSIATSGTETNSKTAKVVLEDRHVVYVYKSKDASGILCMFVSKYQMLAQRNAEMYAADHLEKYGARLYLTSKPYTD